MAAGRSRYPKAPFRAGGRLLPVTGAACCYRRRRRGAAGSCWPARLGLDRADQLSALSLALAAIGILRDHQIRTADAAGARPDRRAEFCAAWLTYRFVEIPVRFGRPIPRRIVALCCGMAAGRAGRRRCCSRDVLRFPAAGRKSAAWPMCRNRAQWRVRQCLLDLSHETVVCRRLRRSQPPPADPDLGGFDRGRVVAGSAQGPGNPRLWHRAVHLQFMYPGAQRRQWPACPTAARSTTRFWGWRASSSPIRAAARNLGGTSRPCCRDRGRAKAETNARVIVLGPAPGWKRGLPNEVLRYFMLHHLDSAALQRRRIVQWYDAEMRAALVPEGAEFISAWDALCNADGCLTRIGDSAGDISASDQVHLTEKGSDIPGSRHHRPGCSATDDAGGQRSVVSIVRAGGS